MAEIQDGLKKLVSYASSEEKQTSYETMTMLCSYNEANIWRMIHGDCGNHVDHHILMLNLVTQQSKVMVILIMPRERDDRHNCLNTS